jgi:hypothetical protein
MGALRPFISSFSLLRHARGPVCPSCSRRLLSTTPEIISPDEAAPLRRLLRMSPAGPDYKGPKPTPPAELVRKLAAVMHPTKPSSRRRSDGDVGATPQKEREAAARAVLERLPNWAVVRASVAIKFKKQVDGGAGWSPTRRLSPDTVAGVRALHAAYPEAFSLNHLARRFGVPYEAMRRIVKGGVKGGPDAAAMVAADDSGEGEGGRRGAALEEAGDETAAGRLAQVAAEAEREESVRARWERRGARIWADRAAKGHRPPAKWREMGVGEIRKAKPLPRWKQAEWWKENIEGMATKEAEDVERRWTRSSS